MAQGLYISPTEFVRFADGPTTKRRAMGDEIATRQRSPDFTALGLYLPNPDPILKKQGKDVAVYTELRSDAHVGGCIRRRKAGVTKMEWRVERGKASARSTKLCEQVLAELELPRLMREILDAPLMGWQPLEVMWSAAGGPMVPREVLAKPSKWFHFDAEAQLRFKSREAPFDGELLPARKFLVPAQDASYANPYGFADLSMCFWPTVFKRGGLKFWVTFTEKFGTPWLVGKVPRGTARKEQDSLLDQLESMVQDACAVIPDDASVDVVEAGGKTGSAELYERLLMFCRSEISIALLGQNQTTESSANRASATAGLQVTEDLRDNDARLVEGALNQLLRWVVDLNEGEAAPAPTFELFEQEEVDKLQAERDEVLVKAGAKLTRAYFMRTYGLEEDDIEQVQEPAPPGVGDAAEAVPGAPAAAAAADQAKGAAPAAPAKSQPAQFAEGEATPTPDALDHLVDVAMADWQPMLDPVLQPLQALLDEAAERGETAAELLARLPAVLAQMDAGPMQERLARTMFAAQLGGVAGLDPAPPSEREPAFAEAAPAVPAAPSVQPLVVHIHNALPEQAAPVVTVHNALPEQAAPVVHVHHAAPELPAPVVQVAVQPAEVTVLPVHPARAVQTVERDPDTDEIVRTVTDYEAGPNAGEALQ